MQAHEADALYKLLGKVFPATDPERLLRLREKFIACNLPEANVREIIHQHRETFEYLTEPKLLEAMRREMPAGPSPSDVAISRQRAERERWERDKAADAERLEALNALPPARIAELASQALARLANDKARELLATRDPMLSPIMRSLMAAEAGIGARA